MTSARIEIGDCLSVLPTLEGAEPQPIGGMMNQWNAIPTTYNGHEFRSRFEANVALILDRLGVKWEYEAKSFLLPDGTHFRPDFWLCEINTWLETRGYSTEKGERQLEGFPAVMEPHQVFLCARLDEMDDRGPYSGYNAHSFIHMRTHPQRSTIGRKDFARANDVMHALEEALCEMGYCPYCADPETYEEAFADAWRTAAKADTALGEANARRPRKGRIYADMGQHCVIPIYSMMDDVPLRSDVPEVNSTWYVFKGPPTPEAKG